MKEGQVVIGNDMVRFNNEKDVILVDYETIGRLGSGYIETEQIQYLALSNFSFYADQW